MEPHGDNEGSKGDENNELNIDENKEEIAICEETNEVTSDTEKLNLFKDSGSPSNSFSLSYVRYTVNADSPQFSSSSGQH